MKLLPFLLATPLLAFSLNSPDFTKNEISLGYSYLDSGYKQEQYEGEVKHSRKKGDQFYSISAGGAYQKTEETQLVDRYNFSSYFEKRFDQHGVYSNAKYEVDAPRGIDSLSRVGAGYIWYIWDKSEERFLKTRLGLQHRQLNSEHEFVPVYGYWAKFVWKELTLEHKFDIEPDEYEFKTSLETGGDVKLGIKHSYLNADPYEETQVISYVRVRF